MPEKWEQVKELFALALERDPGERGSFLLQACAGDDSLRAEVESLLSSFDGAAGFLEDCPAADLLLAKSSEIVGNEIAGKESGRTAPSARLARAAWPWFTWANAMTRTIANKLR